MFQEASELSYTQAHRKLEGSNVGKLPANNIPKSFPTSSFESSLQQVPTRLWAALVLVSAEKTEAWQGGPVNRVTAHCQQQSCPLSASHSLCRPFSAILISRVRLARGPHVTSTSSLFPACGRLELATLVKGDKNRGSSSSAVAWSGMGSSRRTQSVSLSLDPEDACTKQGWPSTRAAGAS